MTATLRFSRQARADLIDIWRGIARRNEIAADRIIGRIEGACHRLSAFPHLGRTRPDVHPDGRVLVVDRWLVLYESRSSAVFVIRVLDGRRDLMELRPEPLQWQASPRLASVVSPSDNDLTRVHECPARSS